MSKTFSDEERDAILAESYAALDRTAEIAAVAKMPNENESPTRISEPPTETRNQRHIREIEEQEARFERERAEERRREMRERRAQLSHQRIDGLEEQVLEVVRCMITACEGLEKRNCGASRRKQRATGQAGSTRNRVGRTAFGAGRARRQGHRPPIAVGALRTKRTMVLISTGQMRVHDSFSTGPNGTH